MWMPYTCAHAFSGVVTPGTIQLKIFIAVETNRENLSHKKNLRGDDQ